MDTPELLQSFKDLDLMSHDILKTNTFRKRRSPVIAKIADPDITHVDLQRIIEAGANVIWLKTALMTRSQKIKILSRIDKASEVLSEKHGLVDWPVASCIELKTNIVTTGLLEDGVPIMFKENTTVTLTNELEYYNKCNRKIIFVDNSQLTSDVIVGTEITIDHYEILLICKEILSDCRIKCMVVKGGRLSNFCVVCARGRNVKNKPVISKKDLEIVRFALEYQVDMIVINYAREPQTIMKVKEFIGTRLRRPLLIAGICTMKGLNNVEELIKEADGILFSREFLYYELETNDSYKMIRMQKYVAGKCMEVGKPFYLSGGIARHTNRHMPPPDNDSSDLTNAILDGVTGFVLKEAHNPEYTVDAINLINDVCCFVEPFTYNWATFLRIINAIKMPVNAAEAAALSCAMASMQTQCRAIIVPTVSGKTVRTLLRARPKCLVITISMKKGATRQLQAYRSCVPLLYRGAPMKKWSLNQEARVNFAVEYAVKKGWLRYGDMYVTLKRSAEENSFCDMVSIWPVQISVKRAVECPASDGITSMMAF